MSKVLGLSIEKLKENLDKLEKLEFIEIYEANIKDTFYIRVNIEEIINFKKDAEAKNILYSWDTGLKSSHNPTYKPTNFSTSTNQIKQFIEEQASNVNLVSMVVYSYIDEAVKQYENKTNTSILDKPNFWEWLSELLQEPTTFVENFINEIEKMSYQ